MGIFQHDNVDRADVEKLVDAFPGQSIDFFGALRARVYDDKVQRGRGGGFKVLTGREQYKRGCMALCIPRVLSEMWQSPLPSAAAATPDVLAHGVPPLPRCVSGSRPLAWTTSASAW
jgi:hypothetical protein